MNRYVQVMEILTTVISGCIYVKRESTSAGGPSRHAEIALEAIASARAFVQVAGDAGLLNAFAEDPE